MKLFVKALHEGNSKAERVTAERVARLEAESIALQIFKACRSGYYGDLDPKAREACIRMFANRGWELPPELGDTEKPSEELTLKKASEIFLGYPGIKEHPGKWRYITGMTHLREHLEKDKLGGTGPSSPCGCRT